MTILNGYNLEKMESLIKRHEAVEEEMESSKARHMSFCKERRADLKLILGEVKDAGLPDRHFKQVLLERKLERKKTESRKAFDDLELETLDLFEQHLGMLQGTPLGNAAAKAAGLMNEFAGDEASAA